MGADVRERPKFISFVWSRVRLNINNMKYEQAEFFSDVCIHHEIGIMVYEYKMII